MNNKAYMTETEFDSVLAKLAMDEIHLRHNYDAVFHLVTAAKGAEQFYILANNQARTETTESYEIEQKFLIKYLDIEWLSSIKNCQCVEIIQTYLRVDPECELRIRQRGLKGNYIYYETTKKK